MKLGVAIFLAFCLNSSYAANAELSASEYVMLRHAVYREASGCSLRCQRATVDTILARREKTSQNVFKVLSEPHQFPWHKSKGQKYKVPLYWLTRFREVYNMEAVLDKNYLYFNTTRHKFGKQCKHIDKLWFCK